MASAECFYTCYYSSTNHIRIKSIDNSPPQVHETTDITRSTVFVVYFVLFQFLFLSWCYPSFFDYWFFFQIRIFILFISDCSLNRLRNYILVLKIMQYLRVWFHIFKINWLCHEQHLFFQICSESGSNELSYVSSLPNFISCSVI